KVRCVFEVTDTGIGMLPEDLERIFNQFEQANPNIAKNYGGTGLGLTIVKALVDAQGGTLEVSSKSGFGSTFKVTLAFEKSSVPQRTVSEGSDAALSDAFDGKVIVVDDDPLILRLCSLILTK